MSRPGGCDEERIFDLAERTLEPDEARSVRTHLDECPGCLRLYERNVELNARLNSIGSPDEVSHSVCRDVVMAIPTRSVRARIYWGALAFGLLVVALLASYLSGSNLVALASSTVGIVVSFVSGFAEMARTILVMGGPVILIALLVGTLVDVLIAVVLLSALRRRSRAA